MSKNMLRLVPKMFTPQVVVLKTADGEKILKGLNLENPVGNLGSRKNWNIGQVLVSAATKTILTKYICKVVKWVRLYFPTIM